LRTGYDVVSARAESGACRYDVTVRESRERPLPRDLTPEKVSFAVGVVLIVIFLAVWVLHLT
jgi:4-hydroxybenzoate polyprenyltransferase